MLKLLTPALVLVVACNTTKSSSATADSVTPPPSPSAVATAPAPTAATSAPAAEGVTSEARSVGDFHAVRASGALQVRLTVGAPTHVVVEAEARLLPQITTEVKNGVLAIEERGEVHSSHPIRVTISAPNVSSIIESGAGSFDASGLAAPELSVHSSGAVTLSLAGKADQLTLTASGTGALQAKDLTAKAATVTLSGAGSVVLTATESLDVTLSGVGRVEVFGGPKTVKKQVTGVGAVIIH